MPDARHRCNAMKKTDKNGRKVSGKLSDIVWSNREERDRAKKKKTARPAKPHRDHASAREHAESPRGSTIPAYPKERIDD